MKKLFQFIIPIIAITAIAYAADKTYKATSGDLFLDASGDVKIPSGTNFSVDGAVTINDSGADVDFRVESDGAVNALVLDGTTGNVGIGVTIPSSKFQVAGSIHSYKGSSGATAQAGFNGLVIEDDSSAGMTLLSPDADGSYIGFGSPADNYSASVNYYVPNNVLYVGTRKTGGKTQIGYADGSIGVTVDTGNVGIGTGSPSSYYANANNLVVYDSSASGISIVTGDSTDGWLMFADGTGAGDNTRGAIQYDHATDKMVFRVNNGSKMYIDSSGNVGIGVSPIAGYKLQTTQTEVDSWAARFTNSNTTRPYGVLIDYQGSPSDPREFFNITNSGSTVFRVSGNGNVGIGVSPGAVKTQIVPTTAEGLWVGRAAAAGDTLFRLGSTGTSIDTHAVMKYDQTSNFLSFQISGDTNSLVVADGGNVGIGDADPKAKLDVNGSINSPSFLTKRHGQINAGAYGTFFGDNDDYGLPATACSVLTISMQATSNALRGCSIQAHICATITNNASVGTILNKGETTGCDPDWEIRNDDGHTSGYHTINVGSDGSKWFLQLMPNGDNYYVSWTLSSITN